MSKMNLTEATMLALQGKLEESKPALKKRVAETRVNRRRLKKENIDVNVDDQTNVSVMGNETIVDTPDATVIVDKKEDEFIPEQSVEAPVDTIEVPVEGDETIVPEVDAPIDTPDVDLPLETAEGEETAEINNEEEVEEESKKVESVEIEVSDEGDKVEVTTDNGEEVEVIDETPEENAEDGEEKEDTEGEEEVTEIEAPVVENKKLEDFKKSATSTKKDEARAKMIKERVEKLMAKREEAKKSFKYNLKSFNEALSTYYKRNTKTIESAEITKLNIVGKSLVIEAKLTNKDGINKTTKLEMRPITRTNNFTRYNVTEITNIKNESKSNKLGATMLTFMNKNNITECKYINKK